MIRLSLAAIGLAFLLSGCNQSSDATTTSGQSCTPPRGIVSLTPFDNEGRLLYSSATFDADGNGTVFVCDGNVARPIHLTGVTLGGAKANQEGFATDGARNIIRNTDIVTTSTSPVAPAGLEITIECLAKYWGGACDKVAAPATSTTTATPATPVATASTTPGT